MATPNEAAKKEPPPEQEPEGIRRMREDYSPEKVEEILDSIRRGMDDYANGRYITLEDHLKQCGVTEEEVLEEYLEKRGLTKDDIK